MTIEVVGPDSSSFQFPDGTPDATITAAMSKHYGTAPAAPEQDVRFTPEANTARAALRGVPILGAGVNRAGAAISAAAHPITGVGSGAPSFGGRYAENLKAENAAQAAAEAESPLTNALAQGVGGSLALGGVGGAFPAAARAMGMTGRLLPAMRNAALSGSAISAADAAVRGENPLTGAVVGGITGPAGVLVGKGVGKAVDEGVRALRGAPAVPLRTMDVNGTPVPIRESMETGNPDTSRLEQALLREGQPAAIQGEEAAQAGMRTAQDRFAAGLDPTGASPGSAPLEAGDAVARDLVAQEQARAANEVDRTSRALGVTQALRDTMDVPGQPIAPQMPQDVGAAVSQGVGQRFQAARGATRTAYGAVGQIPGEFAPGRLLPAGQDIRMQLNSAPGDQRVRISPEVTPAASNMLRSIDEEISQLQFTNDAARGNRPITPADMEQVRKQLVIQRRLANNAARTTGNWEDARAASRVMEGFDDWLARVVRRPGGFTGDAQAYLDAIQAARGAHAQERAAFSRRGPGDVVGSAMESIIGKYPGQEMSPEKIIKTVLGSPDNPGGAEHAVALLTRLRDVLGPQSPEWAAVKKAAISHFTEPVPGGETIPLKKQADRMMRFLGNERHSGAIFDQAERGRLMAHAQRLQGVEDALPMKGTVEQKIAILSGRITGEPATGAQVVATLMNHSDPAGAKLAAAVMPQLTPESRALLKQGIWSKISGAVEGATPWGNQKTGESIAKFLNTDLARTVFTPNERMLMKAIADAHHRLVPIPGSTNPSGTAHMAKKLMTGARKQLLTLFGFAHGGMMGASLGAATGNALDWITKKQAAMQAEKLFLGAQPRGPGTGIPQAALATVAHQPISQDQSQ